jgi:hypothetical protein
MPTALAWLLRHSPNILLIPGTSSLAHLRENVAAAEMELPEEARPELEGIAARGVVSGPQELLRGRPVQVRPNLLSRTHAVSACDDGAITGPVARFSADYRDR